MNILICFNLLTTYDPGLTRDHPRLRKVSILKRPRHDQCLFISFVSILYGYLAHCTAKPAAMTDGKNPDIWPNLWRLSDPEVIFRNIFGKFTPGAFESLIRIENRSSNLAAGRRAWFWNTIKRGLNQTSNKNRTSSNRSLDRTEEKTWFLVTFGNNVTSLL